MRCSFCGSNLHTIKNCPKTFSGQSNRRNMRCAYCESKQHTIEACPKTWKGSSNLAWHKDKIEDDFILDF